MSSKYTPEQVEEITRQAHENLMRADELLAERHAPLNVVPLVRKPPPEPEPKSYRLTDSEIAHLARDTAEQLSEFRDFISGELCSLLTETFGRTADSFDEVHELLAGLRSKGIESDVAELKIEVAAMRGEMNSTKSLVEHLINAVAELRDQVESVERANKIVSFERRVVMTEEEIRRREKIAFEYGVQEAKAAIFDDLRNLAGNFALELYNMRRELRTALNLPPLPDDDECDHDGMLQ